MRNPNHMYLKTFAMALAVMILLSALPAMAASKAEINSDSSAALETLKKNNVMAKALAGKAKGILVFPKILKAGFIIGGEGGNGVLFKHGKGDITSLVLIQKILEDLIACTRVLLLKVNCTE